MIKELLQIELHPNSWTKNPTEEMQLFMTKFSIEETESAFQLTEEGAVLKIFQWKTGIGKHIIQITLKQTEKCGRKSLTQHPFHLCFPA